MAYGMRMAGFLKDSHIAGLKFLTFNISLPMLLCSVLWTSEFKSQFLTIAVVSAVAHSLIPLSAYVLTFQVEPRELRGYLMMTCQGSGLAYSYQAIISSFGVDGLAAACLWDIGGNLWLMILGNGIVGSIFRPPPVADTETVAVLGHNEELPEVVGQTIKQRAAEAETSSDEAEPPQAHEFAIQSTQEANSVDLDRIIAVLEDPAATVSREYAEKMGSFQNPKQQQPETEDDTSPVWKMAAPIVKMPVLWGVLVGVALNVCRVPLHYLPIKVMHVLAQCFPPLLYILLGSVLRFSLGRTEYIVVIQALLRRWLIMGTIASIVWFLPLDSVTHCIIVLCLAAPATTTMLMYAAEFGYNAPRCAMTYNLSALTSMFVIHLLNTTLVAKTRA
eukprot:TRINITY_DN55108_c0_g1_i1.p1 TRINITY_DN55108_c0_g1~~TRINITY_DN55108_c0_g1_i1.p1  ORF type:complete len:435 (-),score=41.19 TRINITY_DN55108_c0_g1_i1:13-1179(-)